MSSKPIYPHVPYFYIIEHVASGKKYAGCRYAKGCNPAEFMTEDGYCTSSSTVKQIIEDDGIDAFVVVEIKTIDEVGDVYEYETKFLTENDCAASDVWLNAHNNAGMTFGTDEFKEKSKQTCLKNHGVEYPMHSEKVKDKVRRKNIERHGAEHAMQAEHVKEKHRQTCLKNHGVEYPMQSEEIKEKTKLTNLKRRGVENPMQTCEVRDKAKQTNLKRRGVEHPGQSEEIKEKTKLTNLKRRGVEYALQSEDVREKSRQTNLKLRGVEHPGQSEEVKEKSRQTNLKRRGVENPMQTKENKERMSKFNFERLNLKIDKEIINGDFSRFVYLYDTVDHVFLMGVEKSLNRGLETKRYIKIIAHWGSFKKYVDVLTGKTYQINHSKFSVPLPSNFILC